MTDLTRAGVLSRLLSLPPPSTTSPTVPYFSTTIPYPTTVTHDLQLPWPSDRMLTAQLLDREKYWLGLVCLLLWLGIIILLTRQYWMRCESISDNEQRLMEESRRNKFRQMSYISNITTCPHRQSQEFRLPLSLDVAQLPSTSTTTEIFDPNRPSTSRGGRRMTPMPMPVMKPTMRTNMDMRKYNMPVVKESRSKPDDNAARRLSKARDSVYAKRQKTTRFM